MCSLRKANLGTQQWKNAHESLLNLEKSNVASVDSVVRYVFPPMRFLFNFVHNCSFQFLLSIRSGMEANQDLRAQFSSAMSAALGDVESANKDLLSSIDRQYLILHAHYYIDFKFVLVGSFKF